MKPYIFLLCAIIAGISQNIVANQSEIDIAFDQPFYDSITKDLLDTKGTFFYSKGFKTLVKMGEILGISIQSDKEVAGANRVPVSNQENAQNIVTKLDSIQNAADKSSFDELTEEDKKKINEFLSSISNHSQYIKELGTITINVTKENYVSVQDLINRTTQTFAYIMQKRNLIESNQQKKLEPVNIKNDLHQKAAQKKAEQEKAAEVFADKVKTRTDYAQAVKEARTAADRIQTPVKTNHNEARHVIKA